LFAFGALGGSQNLGYLKAGQPLVGEVAAHDLLAFFLAAFLYFIVNSFVVSGVLSLARNVPLKEVWRTNTLWVLGYDLGASSLSILIAWIYIRFDASTVQGKIFFLLVFLPIIAAKHIYSKLNTLQSLYDQLDSAHEKLELALREQLEMMVKSIEARDPYTSGHSRRVSALSKAIAYDLGLDEQRVDEIQTAALLHDVGKIHEEFAPLLQKEGRLTQEEWEIMKTHAAKSAELVGLFTRFRGTIQDSVRSHHERWDGKGYPDGRTGEEIPLGARIIMISDTIDAMTTDRPYRKALSFEKVVAELTKYRGIQFDPMLVDVTINSVTVRRLVSDKEYLDQQTVSVRRQVASRARPALRSQNSFLDAVRLAKSERS
jgi:putative nucleotidyltransferase with HDIG domain